jgi:hypothetical protein
VVFWDGGMSDYIDVFGGWLGVLGIGCQVMVTKESRRISIFGGYYPMCFALILIHGAVVCHRAFQEGLVFAMWTRWLHGVTEIVLALDLFYYVLYAKRRNDDFELPSPFTES